MASSPSGETSSELSIVIERESCETTDRLLASIELKELKEAFVESPPRPSHARGQDF
jgi:hypothetical protein